ncbi:MAG: hypothetical protein Q4D48_01255 [Coriobacteriales bacterium]|nr:hypothetical protein [Coriobacteriales bacterium]
MAYSTPDSQRGSSRRHQGRAGDSRISNTGSITSSGTRRVQARGGSSSQYRSSRNRRSRSNGYQLNNHSRKRRGGLLGNALNDPKLLILMILGLALVIALIIFGFGAIRGCINKRAAEKKPDDGTDTRVSLAISSDMAAEFTSVLDRNELFATIAQNADAVGDARLLELALRESSAIEYVHAYATKSVPKGASAFNDTVTKGYYPKLFIWDTRWGYVTYGEGPMGLTGSGPTALSMAYMGLTGKTDQTPDALAKKAMTAEATDKVYDTKPDFFFDAAEELGLKIEEFSPTGENLSENIQSGTAILVQLRERTLTDNAHWALAIGRNLDGSINLYDPTSTAVTEHPWDPDTIAAGADVFYTLKVAPVEEE